MTVTCSLRLLTLACRDDLFNRNALRFSSAVPSVCFGQVVGNHDLWGAILFCPQPAMPVLLTALKPTWFRGPLNSLKYAKSNP